MRLLVKILFLLLPFSAACSQQIGEDLKRINQSYAALKSFSAKVSYTLFSNSTSTIPVEKLMGEIKRKGNRIYSKIGNSELISSETFNLQVDHNERSIIILNARTEGKKDLKDLMDMDFAPMLKFCKNTSYRKLSGKSAMYTMFFVDEFPEYEKVEFVFNTSTLFIEKLVLYYKNQEVSETPGEKSSPRLELVYSNMEKNVPIDDELFSMDKFLSKEGNRYVLKSSYKNYHLLNQYSR
jgi:outer membrane lipoprotein-sorting protein